MLHYGVGTFAVKCDRCQISRHTLNFNTIKEVHDTLIEIGWRIEHKTIEKSFAVKEHICPRCVKEEKEELSVAIV